MIKNEIGNRYGMLEVVALSQEKSKRREARWLCRCDCGNEVVVYGSNLRNHHSTSCGCNHAKRGKENGNFKGGHYKDRLYHVWMSMKMRCQNPRNAKYKDYGGRGIRVCKEWQEYEIFRAWAYENGYDDKAGYGKSTIDRIDVNGNYEPSNCRFTDLYTQSQNRRNVIERRKAK